MIFIQPGEDWRSVFRRREAAAAERVRLRDRCVHALSTPLALVVAVLAAIVISAATAAQ